MKNIMKRVFKCRLCGCTDYLISNVVECANCYNTGDFEYIKYENNEPIKTNITKTKQSQRNT